MTRRLLVILVAAFALMPMSAAVAETYPTRTVQIIEPTPPGGGADLVARLLAQFLSDQSNGHFVVVNKPGAGGLVGAREVADAKPDGYTLLLAASAMTMAPYLTPTMTIDVEHDLSPITEVASGPFVMVVNPSIPVKNPRELVAYAKAHPNTFRWGGTLGSPDLFSVAQFDNAAGIKPLIVPFNGDGPARVSLLGGELSAMIIVPTLVKGDVQAGKLRALAVTTSSTIDFMPGIPTVASFGYPGFESTLWYGLWGPKGMSSALATRIHDVVSKVIADPGFQAKLHVNGLTAVDSKSPQAFAVYVHSEVKKNLAIINANHMRVTQ